MKHLLLAILFSFQAILASAQVLKGKIADGELGSPLAAVSVMNQRTFQTVYSDAKGNFSLPAISGDAISFSFIGYKPQQKIVPASIGVPEMHIDLFKLNYELEEFIYRPKYTAYQLDSIKRKATYSRTLAREKSGSLGSPITFFAEKLSRRSKQIFNFQKSFNFWEDQKFIDSRYSPELVQQLTSLNGDTLAWFMNANPLPYDFARAASELELKMWIREKYKEWRKDLPYPPATTSQK